MKKLLASLLVLAMCAPAMALTLSSSTDGAKLIISYDLEAGETLRGLALTVTNVSGDGVVAASGDYVQTGDRTFNTFMDFAADVDNVYTAVGQGHPFALITPDVVNGQYEAAFPAASFALSLGYLHDDGTGDKGQGITTSGTIEVTFTGSVDTQVAVALDTFRGGAVGDGLVITNNLGTETLVFAQQDCYTEGGLMPGSAAYTLWESVGKPECWCFKSQCYGDANGAIEAGDPKLGIPNHRVGAPDLTILANGWQKPDTDPGFATFICADFNRTLEAGDPKLGIPAHRVGAADLTILSGQWQKGTTPEDCSPGTR
jgi:hypothetical protein